MKTVGTMARRKFAWIFVLSVITAQLSVGTATRGALANNLSSPDAPNGTGYWLKVPDSYHTIVNNHTNAYWQAKYLTNVGGAVPTIVLDFGRQWQNPDTGNWGVSLTPCPPGGCIHHSMTWVASVAHGFIAGWNDGHPNQSAHIAIGTSNANYPWYCTESSNDIDVRWNAAGLQWGTMIASLADYPRAYVYSANDIEDWNDPSLFGTWTPCASGALQWYNGFRHNTTRVDYDYGNDPYPSEHAQWSTDGTMSKVYYVAYGPQALVLPEVYCSQGNATPWVDVRQWAADHSHFMYFTGVTSLNRSNGGINCNPNLTYTASWNDLNNVLTNAGWSGNVVSTAFSFTEPYWH